MKKQNSIDWLLKKIWWEYRLIPNDDIIEEAKAMHKEEIIESYCQGCLDMTNDDTIFPRETSEQYYNETFEK